MAEILGFASSVITVVGVAGKLGTSTIRLKRLWDEVQDVPASIQRCIEHLELLAPAIEEMDYEFQRTRTMVQNDSAAKRSLGYSRKAVATLERLVRDMENQLNSAKKGRRLVAQLKIRMKKEVIEEHQQQLQSVLQLVTVSQQTYLIALSRAQPEIIISEIKNWQESSRMQKVSESVDEEDVATDHEPTTGNLAQETYSHPGSTNWWASNCSIPWQNAGLFGKMSYLSNKSAENISTSQVFQLRVQPPNWLASKAWDLQVCRALTGWNIQMRTWITRPLDSDVFRWVKKGATDKVIQAIVNKEVSLYDRTPQGFSLSCLALFSNKPELLKQLILLGTPLDDIDVGVAIFSLIGTFLITDVTHFQELNLVWTDYQREMLTDLIDEKSGLSKGARITKLWKSLDHLATKQSSGFLTPLDDPVTKNSGDFLASIDWTLADPQAVLETISRDSVNVHEIRRSPLVGCQLQDFGVQYFHEYLNCSPWMEDWRLIARKLFENATWEDLAALHIDQVVKDIWQWQFPLGVFERWLDRVLGMLKEDITRAGGDFKKLGSAYDMSYEQNQPGSGITVSTGDSSKLWGCSWDPYPEGLAGEFWSTIEASQLAVPGSWISDDEDTSGLSDCLFKCADRRFFCITRRLKFYRGNERIDDKLLRVKGMITCREVLPLIDSDGTMV